MATPEERRRKILLTLQIVESDVADLQKVIGGLKAGAAFPEGWPAERGFSNTDFFPLTNQRPFMPNDIYD